MLTERTKSAIKTLLKCLDSFCFAKSTSSVLMAVSREYKCIYLGDNFFNSDYKNFILLKTDIIISRQEFLVATLNMIVKHEFRCQQNR